MTEHFAGQTILMPQGNTPMIVTGVLVEEPNYKLKRWIKACGLTYFMYYMYLFVHYLMINPPIFYWLHMGIMCFFLSLFLPMCGLSSSKKSRNGSLALFAGIQAFLAFWNIFLTVSLWTSMAMVTNACQECQKFFDLGNKTCDIDSLSESIEITSEECLEKHPNVKEYVFSVMYIALATVSFMTAVHSRKKTKAKIAQLVSVESISVNSPPTIDPPEVIASIESPPEDQH